MNSPLIDFLASILGFVLNLTPIAAFISILFFNARLAFGSSRPDPASVFAYLGGFVVFAIGFAVLRTNPSVNIGMERDPLLTVVASVGIGVGLGWFFMYLIHWSSSAEIRQNWFILITNGAISLALTVYIFINGLQDVIVYGTLGFALGVVIQIVARGSSQSGRTQFLK